ncbi:MAG: hypothetical protein FWD49_07900 [Firmicutes bacterium]|nr:hypothetical protein [Bacillota bacterium]
MTNVKSTAKRNLCCTRSKSVSSATKSMQGRRRKPARRVPWRLLKSQKP